MSCGISALRQLTAPFVFSLVSGFSPAGRFNSSSAPKNAVYRATVPLSNRFGLSAIGKPDFCMARTRLPTTGFSVTGARGIQVTGGYSGGVPAVTGSRGIRHCHEINNESLCPNLGQSKKRVRSPSTPHKVYRFALGCDYAAFAKFDRSDRKPARTSSERSWGCSNAAKCPPLSSLL
jgi:hypothetical protein